jgi:multisubunit Na+/H+ antiporter MnhB subunit
MALPPAVERYLPIRFAPRLATAGLVLTLIVAFVPVAFGRPVLTHAPSGDTSVIYLGTIELITAVAFDIGVFFLVFGFAVTSIGLISRTENGR